MNCPLFEAGIPPPHNSGMAYCLETGLTTTTAKVRVSEERRSAKKQRNHWWKEANWPRLKEALEKSRDPSLRGQCDVACLELGLD